MAQIKFTVTIPAEQAARVLNGVAKSNKKIDDGEDKEAYLKNLVEVYLKRLVYGAEQKTSMDALTKENQKKPDDLNITVT